MTITTDLGEEVHRGVLEVLVASAAPACQSFAELLERVPGAYPPDVAGALQRLTALRLIDDATCTRLTRDRGHWTAAAGTGEAWELVLPEPHPLDYDWRWERRTVSQLLDRCLRLSRRDDMIALLGTPTLLHAAATSAMPRRWVLLESSLATTAALAGIAPGDVICCDLARDHLPPLDAKVVVADPPWYPEHSRAFVWAAAQFTRPGATVLLAQPAAVTRPGVLRERAELLAFAHAAGLETIRVLPGALAYVCPPFEVTALRASGLFAATPRDWRRGDLIELRRSAGGSVPRPVLQRDEAWQEVVLSGARIRFLPDHPMAGQMPADPRLRRLIDGDVLATVSRRDPVRRQVCVWTSSNRVFACHNPGLLAALAAALAGGASVARAARTYLGRVPAGSERQAIAQAARQLAELARVEASDSRLPAASPAIISGWQDQPAGWQPGNAKAARNAP